MAQVQEHVCAIKLNFHVILPLSQKELARINKLAHSYGLQCIADIKLNDIENTNDVAVDHLLGSMGFDCVIANPFIGTEGFESLVRKAHGLDGGVIALVYMSHKGAREGYGLQVEGKHDLYRIFLERSLKAGADGIVVGASNLEILKELSGHRIPVYSPGIGAQGADAEAAAGAGAHYLIVGRSIIESKDPANTARDLKMRISSAARG
jgi:orotidine-5'-phosphate decarboxylase